MELFIENVHFSVYHATPEGCCRRPIDPDECYEPAPGSPPVAGAAPEGVAAAGPGGRLIDRFRGRLAAAARERGATEEQVGLIGGLGDGTLLELLLRYGPDLLRVLKVVLDLLA